MLGNAACVEDSWTFGEGSVTCAAGSLDERKYAPIKDTSQPHTPPRLPQPLSLGRRSSSKSPRPPLPPYPPRPRPLPRPLPRSPLSPRSLSRISSSLTRRSRSSSARVSFSRALRSSSFFCSPNVRGTPETSACASRSSFQSATINSLVFLLRKPCRLIVMRLGSGVWGGVSICG